jgi:hypothetical protein
MNRGNRRLTVGTFGNELGIRIGSCHQNFTEKLQMRRVSAKFVPRLFTDDRRVNRVERGQELLANANGSEHFLKNIIQEMRSGFKGMMLKQRCNRHSGRGIGSLD